MLLVNGVLFLFFLALHAKLISSHETESPAKVEEDLPVHKVLMWTSTQYPQWRYKELYRDHVYHNLSENGKAMFYAVKIHPSCKQKKGRCIPRGNCKDSMLYISRVCYTHDLVCCYINTAMIDIARTRDTENNVTVILGDDGNTTAIEDFSYTVEEHQKNFTEISTLTGNITFNDTEETQASSVDLSLRSSIDNNETLSLDITSFMNTTKV